MTYVSLNPEGMQRVITELSGYAAKTREQHGSVASANERNDSPVELSSYLQVIAGSASALEDKAKDLQARLDSAKAANESGITPLGVDGTISYIIPDGQDDTAKNALANNNVEIANQARADAEKLKQYHAGNKEVVLQNEDGQTFIDRMKANQSNPAYANVILSNIDPKTLRDIAADPFSAQVVDRPGVDGIQQAGVPDTLSNILATASNTWPTDKARKYAEQLTEDMDDKAAVGVNKLFSASRDVDIDGDGQNESVGLDFNDSLLVDTAKRLEAWNQVRSGSNDYYNERYIALGGRLSGVVHAMTGNVDAATEWLADNGGDKIKTADRVKTLIGEGVIGENQWTDDWTLISAQQAVSNSSEAPNNGADKAAIVSSILNTVGESNNTIKLSDSARNAASISMSANPYGVQQSVDLGDPSVKTHSVESVGWSKDMPEQPLFTNKALTNLTGQIGKNELAKARLAGSQEAFNRSQDALETDDASVINNYKKQSRTRGFIAGAIARQAEIDGADIDKQVGSWAEVGSIAASAAPIPGADKLGEGFAKIGAQFVMNAGQSYLSNGVKNGVTTVFGSNQSKAKEDNDPIRDAGITACQQTVGWNLLSRFYSEEELKTVHSKAGGATNEIVGDDGKLIVSSSTPVARMTGEQRQQVINAVEKAPEKGAVKKDFIDDVGNEYKSAYETARNYSK